MVPFQQALVRISNLGVRVKMIDLDFRSLSRKKIPLLVFLGIRHRLHPKTSLRLRLRNPDFNNRLSADFQTSVLVFTEALPWCFTKPQIIILFYLASHLAKTAANVGVLVESDQSPLQQSLACL